MPPQKRPSPNTPTKEEPTELTTAETAPSHAKTEPSADETAKRTPSNWYTDTLRTIVHRALDADKPDIKGALAALTMLAEAEEPTESTGDIATLLRDARKRAAHARENTD